MRRLTPDRLESLASPKRLGPEGESAAVALATAVDQAEAQRIRQQALFDEARDRGFDEGMQDAGREIDRRVEMIAAGLRAEQALAVAKLEEERAALRTLAGSIKDALAAFATDAETLAVEVAFAGVVRLLGDKAADRGLMQELCRTVVREYGHPPATLRVSEADFPQLDVESLGLPVDVDRRLLPGQCVIDTARGQFESGMDVRLEGLRKALLAGLAEHRSSE